MSDFSHLSALRVGLSNERVRLASAKTDEEKALRKVWVKQREKEVKGEERFLGLDDDENDEVFETISMSRSELLEELFR
ncbi:MAG: hypothetical protein ACJAS1_000567 [Oleiphilaceae bacterium]|jgi:hypothetical protein